jgi:hypothetical protein
MRHRLLVVGAWVGAVLVAQACGGETGTVDGGVDGATNDGTFDVAPQNDAGSDVNSGSDTGSSDTGTTDSSTTDASDGGTTDSGGTNIGSWTCGTATVSDCSACIGHTMPCVYCANADASVLAGVCVITAGGCGTSMPNGYNLCRCNADAGACPEPFQVCLNPGGPPTNDVCDTCGAVPLTNGLTCENGGKCNAADGGCP